MLLLLADLLFGQLVVNLLHDRHVFHSPTQVGQHGEYSLQAHGEHCKICALDILHNVIADSFILRDIHPQAIVMTAARTNDFRDISIHYIQDRGPPILF